MSTRLRFSTPAVPVRATSALAISLCAAMAGGCYQKAKPAVSPAELPPLVDGQELEVDVGSSEEWDVSGNTVRSYKNYRIEGMSYGDDHLTYNQARTLTDPTWKKQLSHHADLVRSCSRANIPRYIGYASVVAGIGLQTYGSFVMGDYGEYQQVAAFGLMGFGALSYLTGWALFGGRKCSEANELADKLRLDLADEKSIYSDALIAEIAPIVIDFNKKQRKLAAKAEQASKDAEEEEEDEESDDEE
jgi:hypothetical protein